MRDDVRSQTVVRNVEDALWRYNEEHEETLSVYDVIGMVLEGLIAEGMCPACSPSRCRSRSNAPASTRTSTFRKGMAIVRR